MKTSFIHDIQELMSNIMAFRYSDLEKERENCQYLLDIGEREKDTYSIAFAHTYFGDYYIAQSDSENCGIHLNLARRLSEENGFQDLMLRINNLYGICYESLADEQTALQYYLQALQLSREHHDPGIECILLNNIASIFYFLQDYEESKKYYLQACESAALNPEDMPNLSYIKLRIWSNFAEVFRVLGELDESKVYLQRCQSLSGDLDVVRNYVLSRGWCGLFADTGNHKKAVGYAKQLLICCQSHNFDDKYLTYEMLFDVCRIMIRIGEQTIAKQVLDQILDMLQEGEVDHIQQSLKLRTYFYETFGSQAEQEHAYREYYHEMDLSDKNLKEVKAKGLKNIIYLDELKNSLTREKNSLDDEAHLDELTRLYNRRFFNKLISKAFSPPALPVHIGIIMLDVDYFKEYNDTYGHSYGDSALQAVAKVMIQNASPSIKVSRYGGDEFVCLCIDVSDEEMITFIEGVRNGLDSLKIEHKNSRCSPYLTLSIGYSNQISTEIESAGALVDAADQGLYHSKSIGRNNYSKHSL